MSERDEKLRRATTIPGSPLESLSELKRKAYITKSARFAAHRRLSRLNLTSLISVSLLAILNILVGIVAIVFSDSINAFSIRIISIVSISISVYLIFLDMFIALRSYEKRSFILMQSARRINELVGEIDALAPTNNIVAKDVQELNARYRQILNDFEEEHSDVDFFFAADGAHKSVNPITRVWNSVKYGWYHLGAFVLFMLFPILLLAVSATFFFSQPDLKLPNSATEKSETRK